MPGRYAQSHKKSRSRFYIFLSILFVVVMFKWGLPFFMNLVVGEGAQRVNTNNDIIPPQTPIISALPDATNSAGVVIEGYTEAGASVELLLNNVLEKIIASDETGAFTFEASLVSGENSIQLRAKDSFGNESLSEMTMISLDTKPIELFLTSPKDGSEYFGKLNQVIDIKGGVDKPGCQILINNSFVAVDKNGSFIHRYMLSGGDNEIKINASDKAGNTADKTIRVVFTP